MTPTFFSAALLATALSAGVATAATVKHDESVDGDLPGSVETDLGSVRDLGTLAPGESWRVIGTVGPRDTDRTDPFLFTSSTPFRVDLVDFDLLGAQQSNPRTTFVLSGADGSLVSFANIEADGTFPNLFGKRPGGSYIVEAIEVNLPQPYELRLTAEVPLPAAGFLLVGGLVAFGAAARRRRRG
jgi:hypothetical protein